MNTLRLTLTVLTLTVGLAACDDGGNAKPATTADAKKTDKAAQEGDKKVAKADAPADAAKPGDEAVDPAAAPPAKSNDAADADADAFEGYDPRVAKAARIAEQIAADPQKADEFLASAELDRDKLDQLMYEIANDADLTAQYRVARGI